MTAENNDLSQAQRDLPNTPAEVIEAWLEPYVHILGWPPCPDHNCLPEGRWRGILSNKTISFWRAVEWRLEISPVEFRELDTQSQMAIKGLTDAHVFGAENIYSEITDGKERLQRILQFVIENGTIPSALVFYETKSGISVIDGHHRLAIYFMNRDPRFRARWSDRAADFDFKIRKWIATGQNRATKP